MRATLSPTFTSSKMKMIFNLISDCAISMTNYYEKEEKERKLMEMKDVFSRFANDVIASTAFGVKCDSFREKKNEFYLMGKEATDFSSLQKSLKLFICFMLPKAIKVSYLFIFTYTLLYYSF